MSKGPEGIKVTVFATDSTNPIHRFADRSLPWVQKILPAALGGNVVFYPHRSVTFPRAPDAGKDLTTQEVARIHDVLRDLAEEIPDHRRPMDANGVNIERVRVERVRRKTLFDRLVINRARADGLIHKNKTNEFMAKLPYTLNAVRQRQFIPPQDRVLSDVASEAMTDLQHHHIPATQHQVQEALTTRVRKIQHSTLTPTWFEQKVGRFADTAISVFQLRRRFTGYDVDKIALNVALEGETSRAISGKPPQVGIGGFMLGGAELFAAWLENKIGWEWPDDQIDRLTSLYFRTKYRRVYTFGQQQPYQYARQVVDLGKATPGVISPIALWALQVKGREALWRKLASGDEEARKKVAQVAKEGLLTEYSRLNPTRRITRRQVLQEHLPSWLR